MKLSRTHYTRRYSCFQSQHQRDICSTNAYQRKRKNRKKRCVDQNKIETKEIETIKTTTLIQEKIVHEENKDDQCKKAHIIPKMDNVKSAMEDKFKYIIEPSTTRGMLTETMLSYHPIAARVVKIAITGKLSVAEESTKFSYIDSKNANLYSHSRKGFNSFLQIVYISHMTKQSYFYIFIGKKSYYSNKTLPMHIHSSCIYKHRNVESIQKSYSRWVIHTCSFSGEQEAAPRSLILETQSLRHSHSATLFARYII